MKFIIGKHLSKDQHSQLILFVEELICLDKINSHENFEKSINHLRSNLRSSTKNEINPEQVKLFLVKSVLLDLFAQGWKIYKESNKVILQKIENNNIDINEVKSIIRRSHLLLRDEQLSTPSVREFITKMERPRVTSKGWHSIFSLMRDGTELAAKLDQAKQIDNNVQRSEYLSQIISPYLQFVEADRKCEFTDLKLTDIWRYFRHTWVTPYKMLPGRSMAILIRDAAVDNHPIIGIGALGSSVAQHSARDKFIGWESKSFVDNLSENINKKNALFLFESVDKLIHNIYTKDLIKEGIISKEEILSPSSTSIAELKQEAVKEKNIHWKLSNKTEYNIIKQAGQNQSLNWLKFTHLPLYKSKRCESLAHLLSIKNTFKKHDFYGNKDELKSALKYSDFKSAISSLIRKIKSERVGINMMDIIICGSIAPYQSILGGKLVCHLLVSSEVTSYYKNKYKNRISIIASSMKGKEVTYNQDLVYLGTTSLYGIGSSQYNRIRIPVKEIKGFGDEKITYKELGVSEGFGTFHFSQTTLDLMEIVVSSDERGRIVNRIFGEGANPLMRLVRQALMEVNLPSKEILQHGYKRVVYGVPMAENFREVLMGVSEKPKYFLPQNNQKVITQRLAKYWIERWLNKRIERDHVLEEVRQHSLTHPIEHGARVKLPEAESEGLF